MIEAIIEASIIPLKSTTRTVPELYCQLAIYRASTRLALVLLQKGAVSVRDYRLWHRGTPNVGSRPRHMLALSYMRRTSYNTPKPGNKTHAGGGENGRFRFAASCTSAFSRDWWPAPAQARHAALVKVRVPAQHVESCKTWCYLRLYCTRSSTSYNI